MRRDAPTTVSVPERGFVALILATISERRRWLTPALRFSPRAGIRGFDTDAHDWEQYRGQRSASFSPRAGIRGFDTVMDRIVRADVAS